MLVANLQPRPRHFTEHFFSAAPPNCCKRLTKRRLFARRPVGRLEQSTLDRRRGSRTAISIRRENRAAVSVAVFSRFAIYANGVRPTNAPRWVSRCSSRSAQSIALGNIRSDHVRRVVARVARRGVTRIVRNSCRFCGSAAVCYSNAARPPRVTRDGLTTRPARERYRS